MSKNSITVVACLDLGAGKDPGEGGQEGGGRGDGEGEVGKVDKKEWGREGETGGGQWGED